MKDAEDSSSRTKNRKSKMKELRSAQRRQRQHSPARAYITGTRTLRTVGGRGGGCQKKPIKKRWGLIGMHAHLVIRQQRRLPLPRQTLGQLPARRIVLEKVAVVIEVPVRGRGVSLELGRIRAPVRRVHDVLVHREVVPAPVPVPEPHRAAIRAPCRLRHLRRRQREARVAPLLWGRRERVGRGRGAVRVR